MEIGSELVGSKLNEIQKKPDAVKLVFENPRTNKVYTMTFRGLLFETSASTLNRRVKNVRLNKTLGFRASSQLRYLRRKPENYRQLFIQMEGSSDSNKLELVGAIRNIRISPKKQASAIKGLSGIKKSGVLKKKTARHISSRLK